MVCHGTFTVLVDTFNIGRCVKSRVFSSSPPSDPVTHSGLMMQRLPGEKYFFPEVNLMESIHRYSVIRPHP